MHLSERWPQQQHQCPHSGCRLVLVHGGKGKQEGGRDLGLWSCSSGAAGLVCAETLRQEGFSDRIVLCTLDRHLPYDRAKLSKVGMGQHVDRYSSGSLSCPRGALPVTYLRA